MSCLKRRRLALTMTQKELSEAIDVTTNTIGQWERHESTPQPSHVRALAELFGISPAEFISGWVDAAPSGEEVAAQG